jgi:hypothetical protein
MKPSQNRIFRVLETRKNEWIKPFRGCVDKSVRRHVTVMREFWGHINGSIQGHIDGIRIH